MRLLSMCFGLHAHYSHVIGLIHYFQWRETGWCWHGGMYWLVMWDSSKDFTGFRTSMAFVALWKKICRGAFSEFFSVLPLPEWWQSCRTFTRYDSCWHLSLAGCLGHSCEWYDMKIPRRTRGCLAAERNKAASASFFLKKKKSNERVKKNPLKLCWCMYKHPLFTSHCFFLFIK